MILRDHGGLHTLRLSKFVFFVASASCRKIGTTWVFLLDTCYNCWFLGFVCLEAILEHVMNSAWNHSLWIGSAACISWEINHLHIYICIDFFHHRLLPVPNRNLSAHISSLQKGPGWFFPPFQKNPVVLPFPTPRPVCVAIHCCWSFCWMWGSWRWDFQNPEEKSRFWWPSPVAAKQDLRMDQGIFPKHAHSFTRWWFKHFNDL